MRISESFLMSLEVLCFIFGIALIRKIMSNDSPLKLFLFLIIAAIFLNAIVPTFDWLCRRQDNLMNYNQYTVCFTPADHCDDLVVKDIQAARKDILVQAYHLSSHKIVAALLAKHAQDVPVTVILDKTARKEAIPFIKANIPVYIDGKVRIAHNKVMIIDNAITITGSFNFTDSAQSRNAENLLVIDNGDLAREYEDNFYVRLYESVEMH